MLEHIALDIVENDIEDFYLGILRGVIIKKFTLKKGIAHSVFNYPNSTNVYVLKIQDLVLELFVNKKSVHIQFQHTCVALNNGSDIFNKALENNYWTYLKKTETGETYFIKDNNGNIFEIKSKI